MSSSVSYYATAEQARLEAERAKARALEDVRQLQREYRALLEECNRRVNLFGEVFDPGELLPVQAGRDDVNALGREARQIRDAIVRLRSRADEKVSLARDEFLQRAVAGAFGGSAVRSADAVEKRLEERGREIREREAAVDGWREKLLEDVGRVASAERIPLEVTEEELNRITSASRAAAAGVANASTSREGKLAVRDLRDVVSAVHASCKERSDRDRLRSERLAEVSRLRMEVAGVEGPLAERVVGLLDAAESDPDQPLPPTLTVLVEEAVRSHEAAVAAEVVRDELAEVFEELGLVVLDGFEIEFADAESLVFKRPGWDRHAVVTSVDSQGRAGFELIREAQGEGAGVDTLSREYEKELCDQVMPKLVNALADRGVHLDRSEIVTLADGHSLIEVGEGKLSAVVPVENELIREREARSDGRD